MNCERILQAQSRIREAMNLSTDAMSSFKWRVAIPRQMFQEILRLIAELRPQLPPAPA
jgi:hypothetical protein